ncbi:zinc finger and BTB domain-containing protein 41-like isoform X2 [Teleopsis dalmanni]|uniref:zinc finger and BTB domain-containing protein 41 isoform X2 n=1 Tax=Teleopsis dalmanni TaxID=139649 RepID=UPI0018CE6B97|nr:zinc finger and BTB domain-containing protein 41 isoform X2 [Teleopsis dalmanni]XP_037958582.1 zinc finger and BTB domain-containing protein 41-like isoform X2 [Teleopsis dalmanni]
MEVLMNVKCSSTTTKPSSTTQHAIDVVDNKNKLKQQQHILGSFMRGPLAPDIKSLSNQSSQSLLAVKNTVPSKQEVIMIANSEYVTAKHCCNQQDLSEIPVATTAVIQELNVKATTSPVYQSTIYDAERNKSCSASVTVTPVTPVTVQESIESVISTQNNNQYDIQYEYHEPEENFVSIDDAKIKGFLMKIGQEQKYAKNNVRGTITSKVVATSNTENVVFEIIELDDDPNNEPNGKNNVDDVPATLQHTVCYSKKSQNLKSGNHSAIKSSNAEVIAQINLIESSDSESDEKNSNVSDNDRLPLAVATVSCELQCDDDENVDVTLRQKHSNEVIILPSDDDDDDLNDDLNDMNEMEPEICFSDYEEQKERTYFECFLCGKKVQSSYNLRRHMMIHTGERPFGCDMCEKRFREFSDLKKHRRRHVKEPNFHCMVCRVNRPTELDPTRCNSCDIKNSSLFAESRQQYTAPASPEKSLSPPVKKTPSRNIIPCTPSAQPAKSVSPLLASSTTISTSTTLPPPLAPITPTIDTQRLLDNLPAVHRPNFNQPGTTTRKEFPCPLCQRPFGTRHNLKRHFMIHTGEKPFSCSQCRKPFREYSTLKKHMVTHQRDRLYKCLRCPLNFRDYLDYIEHKNTHPKSDIIVTSSSNNITSCPKKRSKLMHDEFYDSNDEDSLPEDWIECCECGQRYTDIEAYTEHLKVHETNVFVYECFVCKKVFEEHKTLLKHMGFMI